MKRIMDRAASLILPGIIVVIGLVLIVLCLIFFKIMQSPKGSSSEKVRETIDSFNEPTNQPPSSAWMPNPPAGSGTDKGEGAK